MPSQTATICAGATGTVIVAAGAMAAYWAHPSILWPITVPFAVAERAPEAPAPALPVVPPAPAISAAPTPKQASPASAPAAPSAPGKPAFDVVSVEPTGQAVVAGRAAPGEKVELKDAGKTVAEATANAEGQFVMIPPPLPPGEHSLALSTGAGSSAQTSNAIAVAVVSESAPKAAALTPSPNPPAPTPAPASAPSLSTALALAPASGAASRVAVQSVEASSGGRLVAKGAAEPNALVRLYLSGGYVGDARTGADGRWSLTIKHGMAPGAYEMRADEINPADAKVGARAEAPFDYPAAAAAAPASSPPPPVAKATPADIVVDSIQTHHVESGNTLWGISQKFYGDGSRYQAIFAANSGQIRNPNLIYPGQLFFVPKPEPKP